MTERRRTSSILSQLKLLRQPPKARSFSQDFSTRCVTASCFSNSISLSSWTSFGGAPQSSNVLSNFVEAVCARGRPKLENAGASLESRPPHHFFNQQQIEELCLFILLTNINTEAWETKSRHRSTQVHPSSIVCIQQDDQHRRTRYGRESTCYPLPTGWEFQPVACATTVPERPAGRVSCEYKRDFQHRESYDHEPRTDGLAFQNLPTLCDKLGRNRREYIRDHVMPRIPGGVWVYERETKAIRRLERDQAEIKILQVRLSLLRHRDPTVSDTNANRHSFSHQQKLRDKIKYSKQRTGESPTFPLKVHQENLPKRPLKKRSLSIEGSVKSSKKLRGGKFNSFQ